MSLGAAATQRWTFERLSDAGAVLGESPQWSASEDSIWWVDVTGRRLLRTEAGSGRTRVWPTPEEIGFVVLTAKGIVAGMQSGLFLFDAAGGDFTLIQRLEGRNIRFNDAATDATGRLWAATCDVDNRAPLGRLLRIDPDLTTYVIAEGLLTPNGLAADLDRGRLYISDSHTSVRMLWSASLDGASGTVGAWQEVARFDDLKGRPDGGAIDAEGNYWIAGVDGGRLHGFAPSGAHIAGIATPMQSPTKLAFGGAALDSVFLTSKAGDEGDPGGYLFHASRALQGRAEALFGYDPP